MPGGLLAPALETRPKKLWAWEAPRAVGEATHLPDLDITLDGCSTPRAPHVKRGHLLNNQEQQTNALHV